MQQIPRHCNGLFRGIVPKRYFCLLFIHSVLMSIFSHSFFFLFLVSRLLYTISRAMAARRIKSVFCIVLSHESRTNGTKSGTHFLKRHSTPCFFFYRHRKTRLKIMHTEYTHIRISISITTTITHKQKAKKNHTKTRNITNTHLPFAHALFLFVFVSFP